VLDFAELQEFVDLKLKNYSSGMLVRLAFSTMLQADADVLLIDEVLAVGDAAFQQKCADAFYRMKDEGKTIVLVTHEMTTVEDYCHRAMLIDGGRIAQIGDPAETGQAYLRLNFERGVDTGGDGSHSVSEGVRLLDAWVEDGEGGRVTSIEHGDKVNLRLRLETEREISHPEVGLVLANADGLGLFQFGTAIEVADESKALPAGRRIEVKASLDNPLAPGRYFVHCGVQPGGGGPGSSLYAPNAIDFVVYGGPQTRGLIALDHVIEATVEGGDGG
jgi:energy-coupling factor transporter ATP-binding protein EcfA2